MPYAIIQNMSDNLSTKAYEFLSRKLARGELAPGQKLSERTLAAEIGISRIPMHEAIRQLIDEGALFAKSQSGTYVSAFDRQTLVDIYEVREAIETRQAAAAIPHMTERDRRTLRTHVATQRKIADAFRASGEDILCGKQESDFLAHDFAQHLLLLKKAGNAYAERIVTSAYRRNSFFGLHSHKRNLAHVERTVADHERIAAAVLDGDPTAAAEAMRSHIRASMADALDALNAAG